MPSSLNIRRATPKDAAAICEIYNWYVFNTVITYEVDAVPVAEMEARINERLTRFEWTVAEVDQKIIGYAYFGTFRSRAAYDHTVESSIYLSHDETGHGFGKILYLDLISRCRVMGFREMIGVIALPNDASVALHEKLGFEKIGVFPRSGYKFGKFVDTGFWQRGLF